MLRHPTARERYRNSKRDDMYSFMQRLVRENRCQKSALLSAFDNAYLTWLQRMTCDSVARLFLCRPRRAGGTMTVAAASTRIGGDSSSLGRCSCVRCLAQAKWLTLMTAVAAARDHPMMKSLSCAGV